VKWITELFAALNVATGEVVARTDTRHRAVEFIKFLDLIDASVPVGLDVHVVIDNASTHKTPAVRRESTATWAKLVIRPQPEPGPKVVACEGRLRHAPE
jgi:hypothetical protein